MNAANQSNHFNLHVSGIGYLNRIRWVQPKQKGRKADPFLACSIAALRGSAEDPQYTYFDLRVSGREAAELVEQCMDDVDQRRKVVVSFKVGDIYTDMYERDVKVDGRKTGEKEMACLIKGRLLLINTITVDGVRVFQREAEDDAPVSNGDSDPSAPQGEDADAGEDGQPSHEEKAPVPVVQAPPAQRESAAPTVARRPSFSRPRQGMREPQPA